MTRQISVAGLVRGMADGGMVRSAVTARRILWPRPYAAHANHLVPVSRSFFSLVLLLFAMTETTPPAFRGDFNDIFAIVYTGFAIATLIVSLANWYLHYTLSQICIVADIFAFLVFLAFSRFLDAAFVVMALSLGAHIVFSSVMRWQLRWGVVTAVILNVVWTANLVLFHLLHGSPGESWVLRWSVFAMLGTMIVLWACVQATRTGLPRYVGEAPGQGLPMAASTVSYAMEVAGASDAVLCWMDGDGRGSFACSAAAIDDELPPIKLSFAGADAYKQFVPMVFDSDRNWAVVLKDGKLAAHSASALPGQALLKELEVTAGICLPVDSGEGRNWIILTGIPMLGWGHLRLADEICSEVAQGLARQEESANAVSQAISRLRQTLACDLHDSVAHSLAGAKFLLAALAAKAGAESEIGEDINAIKDALEAEYLHVRGLIEQLRQTASDAEFHNLIGDIEAICPTLASRWQIEVGLVDSDFRVMLPLWLSLEVQQIVREAISNGVRHGKASQISIKCRKRAREIQIEVTDNGEGFADPQSPSLPRSISERLEQLGGRLEIVTAFGSTTLKMSLPSHADPRL
ncbi:sensor histidine kinase [Novosphingobium album (ex Hu et al. 2023)]|uniref:Histidine kinase n=1 Tax=Novosphingobium album (ex Hu et al. 2023) TaxID=2930093 RepID=A0ABT0B100_9SPHN|nr:histidine kinase [Novosphingobium album (ex Hu et al. 2023)]MCJ2178700.1 histidine kinase [Novosphingobium album (ex Hu et al. 2023)]